MRRPAGAAFTLIEVMIVIAIIAVLAAIAVPSYRRVRERSQRKACYANLRSIAGALEWYCADKNTDYEIQTDDDFAPLIEGGYLSCTPQCPSKGKGQYTAKGGQHQAVCAFHGTISPDEEDE